MSEQPTGPRQFKTLAEYIDSKKPFRSAEEGVAEYRRLVKQLAGGREVGAEDMERLAVIAAELGVEQAKVDSDIALVHAAAEAEEQHAAAERGRAAARAESDRCTAEIALAKERIVALGRQQAVALQTIANINSLKDIVSRIRGGSSRVFGGVGNHHGFPALDPGLRKNAEARTAN